jgi:hypothetical protein
MAQFKLSPTGREWRLKKWVGITTEGLIRLIAAMQEEYIMQYWKMRFEPSHACD